MLQTADAFAGWSIVKRHLQTEVQLIKETKDELILRKNDNSLRPLTVTVGLKENSDIYSLTVQQRGGNPYRIWIISERLANDSRLPKHLWGRYFKTAFLRVLRSPKVKK